MERMTPLSRLYLPSFLAAAPVILPLPTLLCQSRHAGHRYTPSKCHPVSLVYRIAQDGGFLIAAAASSCLLRPQTIFRIHRCLTKTARLLSPPSPCKNSLLGTYPPLLNPGRDSLCLSSLTDVKLCTLWSVHVSRDFQPTCPRDEPPPPPPQSWRMSRSIHSSRSNRLSLLPLSRSPFSPSIMEVPRTDPRRECESCATKHLAETSRISGHFGPPSPLVRLPPNALLSADLLLLRLPTTLFPRVVCHRARVSVKHCHPFYPPHPAPTVSNPSHIPKSSDTDVIESLPPPERHCYTI